jgi:hypothetical protein
MNGRKQRPNQGKAVCVDGGREKEKEEERRTRTRIARTRTGRTKERRKESACVSGCGWGGWWCWVAPWLLRMSALRSDSFCSRLRRSRSISALLSMSAIGTCSLSLSLSLSFSLSLSLSLSLSARCSTFRLQSVHGLDKLNQLENTFSRLDPDASEAPSLSGGV